jgi:hypothetical protein
MRETLEIQILRIRGSRFQHHLILEVMLEAIRIIPVSAIGRSPAGLNIRRTPGFRSYCAQKCRRIEGPGPFFRIIRLSQDTVVGFPKLMKGENNILKGHNT